MARFDRGSFTWDKLRYFYNILISGLELNGMEIIAEIEVIRLYNFMVSVRERRCDSCKLSTFGLRKFELV